MVAQSQSESFRKGLHDLIVWDKDIQATKEELQHKKDVRESIVDEIASVYDDSLNSDTAIPDAGIYRAENGDLFYYEIENSDDFAVSIRPVRIIN